MVRDVVEHIQNAYAEKVVNTPYQELPVVCIQSMSPLSEACEGPGAYIKYRFFIRVINPR